MLGSTFLALVLPALSDPTRLARDYAAAIEEINAAHARKPVAKTEAELGKRLPAGAVKLIAELLGEKDSPTTRDALVTAAQAALDLDRVGDFEKLHDRLAELDAERAAALGIALSRPRFLVIGTNGMKPAGLTAIADVFDLVLDGYAEVFGLKEFSKLPGKKLRLRVHLEKQITAPPHFAPEFPYHSEIDFPVIDAEAFRSPTQDGKFLFYGLCHELGHVIAMWGDPKDEEDHHAWAHYTGVVLVEHLLGADKPAKVLAEVKDIRWRSATLERKRLDDAKLPPSGKDRDGVLARLFALHDAVGPSAIGEALNALDASGRHLLVNRVRYDSMHDFEAALLATRAGKGKRRQIEAAFAAD